MGLYVDSLKKNGWARKREIIGIEPNPMGGVFLKKNGPKQLTTNILEIDPEEMGRELGKFDLLYSIEVAEQSIHPLQKDLCSARSNEQGVC